MDLIDDSGPGHTPEIGILLRESGSEMWLPKWA
jgi:hypothetical protein